MANDIPGLDVLPSTITGVPQVGNLITNLIPTLTAPGSVPPIIPIETTKEIKEEKPSGEKAEYGKIQVKENKGGFVEISDETPGNVRKINLHPTGTYDAKLDNGDAHSKTTGKRVDIVDHDWHVTISENQIVIVNKNTKIEIREDKLESIKGNSDLNIEKEMKTKVIGDVSEDFGANYSKKVVKDSATLISGNSDETVDGNVTETIKGNQKETISGNLTINVTGNVTITGQNINVNATNLLSMTAKKVKIN